jgi:Helicase associated domain
VQLLDQLGFEWSASEAVWSAHCEDLTKWRDQHSTFVVPKGEKPELAQWARNQRSRHTRGLLSARRVARLEEVGFPLAPVNSDRWNEHFAELVSFQKDHGHFRVLAVPSTRNRSLGRWLRHQRQLSKEGALAEDRVRKLDELGALAKHTDIAWNDNLQRLLKFKTENGHTEVPQCTGLGRWVHKQRSQYSAGKLAHERRRRLEDIEFSWNARDVKWDRQFKAMRSYYDAGLLELRGKKPVDSPSLSKWLDNQRAALLHDRLSPARVEKLRSIGVQLSNSDESVINNLGKARP